MSGIAGIIDPRLEREEGEVLLQRMLRSIRHRGPDASSFWVEMPMLLGHNRLSIIDLSERANQPMVYDGLVIAHDGLVYNYLEVRRELEERGHRFGTTSDTEVILAAYREWGANCVTRFVGMWSFAIWDRAKKELFCSRDRFGIKPFYYIHSGDRFYFGSEYAPLKLSPIFNSTFDLVQISLGLRMGIGCSQEDTYFRCLKALPERCNLLFKEGKLSLMPYWDICESNKVRGTFEEKRERFLELFRDSVRLQMRSDVTVGGMLSGGMDSPSIISVIGRDFSTVPFKTFTIYYEGPGQMDERLWASEVPSAYSNIEPIYYAPSDQEVAECFDAVSKAHDVPITSSLVLSSYFVMKLAAERGVKVVLDGTGADTYLAGDGHLAYEMRLIGGQIKKARWLRALELLEQVRRRLSLDLANTVLLGLKSLAIATVDEETIWRVRALLQFSRATTDKKVCSNVRRFHGSRLDQYHYRLICTFPPLDMHGMDRVSMAFSIECRAPFLDHRLVEYVFALDDEDIIGNGQSKYILRKSMEGIVPKAILARSAKQPFVGQEASWLKGPLKRLIERPMTFDGIDIINEREVRRVVRDFREGDLSKIWLVWRLAMLNHWASCQ